MVRNAEAEQRSLATGPSGSRPPTTVESANERGINDDGGARGFVRHQVPDLSHTPPKTYPASLVGLTALGVPPTALVKWAGSMENLRKGGAGRADGMIRAQAVRDQYVEVKAATMRAVAQVLFGAELQFMRRRRGRRARGSPRLRVPKPLAFDQALAQSLDRVPSSVSCHPVCEAEQCSDSRRSDRLIRVLAFEFARERRQALCCVRSRVGR